MKKRITIVVLLSIILFTQIVAVSARPIEYPRLVTLSGRVTDSVSSVGVDGATVRLYDEQGNLLRTATTDSNGYYSGLKGYGLAFNVKCSHSLYVTQEKTTTPGTHTINFAMVPKKIAFIVYDAAAPPPYNPIYDNNKDKDGFLSRGYVNDHLAPDLLKWGFDRVLTFPDPQSQSTLFKQIRASTGPTNWVMLFLCGHGFFANNGGTSESGVDLDGICLTSTELSTFYTPHRAFYIPCSHFLLVVDACHSGEFVHAFENIAKATVVTCCAKNQVSRMEYGSWGFRGVFTHDFFYGASSTAPSIKHGYTVHQTWSFLRYKLWEYYFINTPQYKDSTPSDDLFWFRR